MVKRVRRRNRAPRRKARSTTVKLIKKVIKGVAEHKYFDVASGVGFDYNGSIVDISAIPQGDTEITRDGDQLGLISFQTKFILSCSDATNAVRVIIFKWKMDSAFGPPSTTDILYNVGSTYAPVAMYNHDRRDCFSVIMDKSYELILGTSRAETPLVKFGKKLKGKIRFNVGATSGKNKIYAMYISDSAVVGNPTIRAIFRINFVDV